MPAYQKNESDLEEHLDQQVQFLEASSLAFDAGYEDEAIRLAIALRVLAHDTKKSTSLLKLLGLKDGQFLTTASKPRANNPLFHSGLTALQIKGNGEGSGVTIPISLDGRPVDVNPTQQADDVADVTYVPHVNVPPPPLHEPEWVSFDDWWNEIIFIESSHGQKKRQTLTRKQLVLGTANKEGGGHVDPKVTGAFGDLTRNNSLGVLATGYGGVSATAPPHKAAVRQIAHEMSESIKIAIQGNSTMVEQSGEPQD